jgi:parallel beta-helix repeat protein
MYSKKLIGTLGAGIFALGIAASAAPAQAADFAVNNTNDNGGGSLRSAINGANGTAVQDQILFAIPGNGEHTISLASDLPPVTNPVAIRGYSQQRGSSQATPGSAANPTIVIDATNAVRGLHLAGDGIEVRGLVINNAQADGVWVQGDENLVAGSYIGVTARGTGTARNGQYGVHVDGFDNVVGGPAPADRNVVSGNPLGGVHVHSGTGNMVEGNYLGTGELGLAGFGGGGSGVLVESDQNTVKDNLSSSNFYGVNVMGDENTVQGNTLGTDVGGGASLPNETGIDVSGGDRNLIGGPAEGEGNLVSGNRFSGVSFSAPGGDSADENDVQGNVIGVSALGTPLPNNAGVTIVSSDDNTIGGEAEGTGNVISGNTADGVRIISNSRDNKVQGNWIGTDESDADLGNGEHGVKINDAYNNRVGATSGQNLANVIAHNGANGVTVESGVGNAIVRNPLYDNGGLGIDLGADGTTPNDGALDDDAGPNGLQNGPEINGIVAGEVAWDLETEENATYRLEFFVSDACDPSGSGEAQTHVETLEVNTNGNGDAHDNNTPITAAVGQQVTMTATRLGETSGLPRSTSELSPCEEVE